MDNALSALCAALKATGLLLKPLERPLSFLLITGKTHQGKTTLLEQAGLTRQMLSDDNGAALFYNTEGIVLELSQTWLNRSETLLTTALKHINQSIAGVKITGLVLCIDGSELLMAEPHQLIEQAKQHSQLLERFGSALGHRIYTALLITKLDTFAGFYEFFQTDHETELKKPLGFCFAEGNDRKLFMAHYQRQFDKLLETLSQQLIGKLHPARSTIKRTLIREFPQQLASLRVPLQAIIQSISPRLFQLQGVYLTSARQGGITIDRINQKIRHDYALAIQDQFPQSNNYKAFFIHGALEALQTQTKRVIPLFSRTHKILTTLLAATTAISLTLVLHQYIKTSRQIEKTSEQLHAYETLNQQENQRMAALSALSRAETLLNGISTKKTLSSSLQSVKNHLHDKNQQALHDAFLPDLVNALQKTLANSNASLPVRYQALKIYLMLGDPSHFQKQHVLAWFTQYQQKNASSDASQQAIQLLKKILEHPLKPLTLNTPLIEEVRNYFNALPAPYFYYTLLKETWANNNLPITVQGFDLGSKELPQRFTKAGFKKIIKQLPAFTQTMAQDNWVLLRQDTLDLPAQLIEIYSKDYVAWWKNFIQRTRPQHYQGTTQARLLTKAMQRTQAIPTLIHFLQEHTSPENGDEVSVFNEKIASAFTGLNLLTASAVQDLNQNINELDTFLTTLALVHDQGKTVFELTKSRFSGESTLDPLSILYQRSRQLPDPVASWAKQIADDTWFVFINESKHYLNRQWKKQVYQLYQSSIADRYPFDTAKKEEILIADFDQFFSPQGRLTTFLNQSLKPFLDTSKPQWQAKTLNGYRLPLSTDLIDELIRANVISNMFFPENTTASHVAFTLQKIDLDPMVSNLQLSLGATTLTDSQTNDSYTSFTWPELDARLTLNVLDGNHYTLEETGPWAFFKLLQKVNVLADSNDSASLQILFEVNGNSGRYVLKTQNPINPFSPGILTGFHLSKKLA